MADLTVAKTIMAQLGGGRFKVMTGAKNFAGTNNSLSFRFPSRKGANSCHIELTPLDLYNVSFYRIRRSKGVPESKLVASHEGVYSDALQSIFTNETGLYTQL